MRTSPGLKWENKTYNLKRSIALNNMHVRVRMSCLNFSISSALTKGRTLQFFGVFLEINETTCTIFNSVVQICCLQWTHRQLHQEQLGII